MPPNAPRVGLERNTNDKYYTIADVVASCISHLCKQVNINFTQDLCIEPSAGNGAFIPAIQNLTKHHRFYDIEPEHPDVYAADYLHVSLANLTGRFRKIHVIGNPPFGRQSSMAIKFIKKSCLFADTISFILPRSFKKSSMQKYFDSYFHLVTEVDLPKYSFLVDDASHDVPCVFQIWERKSDRRQIPTKLTPLGFTFVKKEESHDIAFRRVGGKAGTITVNTDACAIQSHYFITFDEKISIKKIDQLRSGNYASKDNTVGPRSISKQELISEFNKILAI
jgi:hypothetical protein